MTTDPHGRPVLIVEDDPGMGVTLQRLVKSMGFSSVLVTTGEDALLTALSVRPLAILMDVLLPGIDGLSVTRHLREKGFSLPIVMISVAKTGADEVAGLVAGADDYIPKPFDVEVFKARFQLALRHARGQTTSNCLVIGQLAFDFVQNRAQYHGHALGLSPIEFRLLREFASSPGRPLPLSDLAAHVWGHDEMLVSNTYRVHIQRLRRKLAAYNLPFSIVYAKNEGYLLVALDEYAEPACLPSHWMAGARNEDGDPPSDALINREREPTLSTM